MVLGMYNTIKSSPKNQQNNKLKILSNRQCLPADGIGPSRPSAVTCAGVEGGDGCVKKAVKDVHDGSCYVTVYVG
jgi:hypothetical protein